jgi:hypothetical protein
MATITFDGPSKTITIGYDGPVTNVVAQDIYSSWKLWVLDGNAQYLPAFAESVGGNELGGGTNIAGYYFVRNDLGWRILHSEFNYQININGDLYPQDPITPFVDTTPDAYSVQFIFQRSAASYISFPEDIGSIDYDQAAAAVWDRNMSSHVTPNTFGKRLRDLLPTSWGIK